MKKPDWYYEVPPWYFWATIVVRVLGAITGIYIALRYGLPLLVKIML